MRSFNFESDFCLLRLPLLVLLMLVDALRLFPDTTYTLSFF